MRNITITGVLVLLLASSAGTAPRQEVQVIQTGPGEMGPLQLPGMGRQLKTGTGVIKGRLLSADTGTPVRRAQVRISGNEIMPKTAVTDGEGRYEFRDLPAGRFNLTATKAGFVTISYGQTRPFESGKPIELLEAQTIDRADFRMPRGSVISGRIVDEFGDPIADAQVSALRSSWMNGRRRLQPTGRSSQTNDLGQYRIYGLPPGEYYVSATFRGVGEVMMMEGIAATMITRSAGDDAGPSASAPRSGYAATYYPGTTNGAEAQKISLSVGQEMLSADFSLLPVRLATVTGMVIGSDGRPVDGALITTVPRNSDGGPSMFPMAGSSRTDKTGQFTLNNVAPGEYTLQARGLQIRMAPEGGDRMVFTTRIGGGGDGETEFGSVPLSVGGDDVANVVIMTSKGTSVSGRVVFEGGMKPANTAALRISALSTEMDGPMARGGGSAAITPEGTFEIKGLAGLRLFRPVGLPAGWVLKSVMLNGTDITDTGYEIRPNEPVTGLDVVLTSKTTEITGSVTGTDNRPATDYTLVIFSEDADKWTVPMTRHVTGARPNQDGRFQVKNMPAGNYYAIAVEYIAQGDWNDPEVLERLKSRATKFSLDEGEVQALDLKLAGG